MASLLARRAPSMCTHHAQAMRTISHTSTAHKSNPFFVLNSPSHRPQPQPSVLRMVMFGKPGAGKGTLSARLVRKYDIASLSTGDLLRRRVAQGWGAAEGSMSKGELLPDEVVLGVVSGELRALKDKHWILDGFPRTLRQGELLDTQLKAQSTPLTIIINLDVPDQVILSRIADRWTHLPSGRVYNMSYNRPKIAGLDDVTGEKLVKRPDDNPETFANRLDLFYRSTSPLLAHYTSASAPLVTLRGNTSDEIWPQLDAVVKRAFPGLRECAESRRRTQVGEAMMAEGDTAGIDTLEREKV